MRAAVPAGLVICLASVAYAHDNHTDVITHASWSRGAAKSDPDPKSEDEPFSLLESQVIDALHAANQTDIAAGKLAAKNSDSPAMQHYARLLVRNHVKADRKLADFAQRRSFVLTGTARDVGELEGKKGAAFDQAFIDMVIDGHSTAIALVKKGQVTCRDAELRMILDRALPALQLHQREALRLQQLARKSSPANATRAR